ncbi:MFS transporter [Deinococcus metallilatus]|uniref:MFS transporter n=1 Tax=Deinococcus metallilatus TaxID=1211322 RepID=A0AAJ5F6A3_9DEIO|nr:MFS transporter [Deinococcus metallilatus]MBB5294439.1 DHA3 family macrolide efflux protein-like MFS transporter [Deinococcus metallilatus]QBY10186.1 MFS transporter [Deinococcus metallilatus]RXJ13912.1 MFS transporter [Deinococcus metallilatus]TLK29878.1 MFS transporter [Deinococcus metallilatus]GMA15655.1 MFS transporter [Deinococcus metallilatus]
MPAKLWNRDFILWLLGSAQSQLGSALASIALSFLVLHQTGSAGRMAQTLALSLAPFVLMPLAGALVDRVSLKVPLIAANIARGLLQLTVGGLALAWSEVPLWVVNGAALLAGLATIFANPASSAAVPGLVPERELARANGLLGSVNQGLWLLGTLAGGWIVSRWSPALAIVLDGVGFLIFAALLTGVRLPPRPPAQAASGVLADVRAGLRLMRRSKVLSFVPVIGFVLNAALAPVMVVLPKLMETLGAGARGYGVYLALESAGMLLAGALIAVLGQRLPPRVGTTAGFVVVTLAYAGMGWAPVFPVLLACALVLGFGLSLLNTPLTTLMQQMVPAAYLGRVFAVLGAASSLGMPLALAAVSPLVDRLPVTLWFALCAGMMALGTLAWVGVVRAERGTAALDVPQEGAAAD